MNEETIPEDVMKAARDVAAAYAGHPYRETSPVLPLILAKAILAEREHCAKIAEAHDLDPEIADYIAAAIRKPRAP